MRNLKRWRVIQSMAVAVAMLAFAGCKNMGGSSSSNDERSEGRTADDKAITEHVQERLKSDPVYKYPTVDTSTFGGVVQLSGFVDTDNQKRRAGEIARQVPGVHQVVNGITLKHDTMTPTGSSGQGQSQTYPQ